MVTLNGCETVEWQDSAAPELCSPFDSAVGEIHKAIVACKKAQSEVDRLKAELKEAKERQAEAHYLLRTLNESLLADEQRPLMPAFDQAEQNNEQSTETAPDDAPKSRESDPDPSDDWRSAPLTELALPNALYAILVHHGVETMGQLEDLRGEIIAGRKEWPKGVGPAKVTLIEDRGTRGHGRKNPGGPATDGA
ncbi:MAG: hypothetical protein R6U98_27190 [Pirellulaceae bacterium]